MVFLKNIMRLKNYFIIMKRKLILHFDVNETILVGDPAGGDSFEVRKLEHLKCFFLFLFR